MITKTKANGTSLLEASDVSELGVIINGSHISKKILYLVLVVMADISCLPQASEIMPIAKIKVKFFSKKNIILIQVFEHPTKRIPLTLGRS